jgi:hypothetical protein
VSDLRVTAALLVACLAVAMFVAGCGGSDSKGSSSGGSGGGGDGKSVFGGGGDCKDADDALKKAAGDHVIPVKVGSGKGNADKITVDVCRTDDDDATATVVVYGLHDPLIKDVRHDIGLVRTGGLWQVTNDSDTRRCQPGHGAQEFEGSICH